MDIYPGRIVVSTAGRDKDRYFVVLSVNGDYCLIADGKVRKVDMPKNKKVKHLRVTEFFLNEIAEMLNAEQTVTNPKIRKCLRALR